MNKQHTTAHGNQMRVASKICIVRVLCVRANWSTNQFDRVLHSKQRNFIFSFIEIPLSCDVLALAQA